MSGYKHGLCSSSCSQRLKDAHKRTLLGSAVHSNKSLGAEQSYKIKQG